MKIYQSGAGADGNIKEVAWAMDRRSGEVQRTSIWAYTTGVPDATLGISIAPAGSNAFISVYTGTPGAGGVFLNLEANGPFTIRCSSATTAAGAYSVYAQ